MITGSLTLNGLNDADLINILQIKESTGSVFTLNPTNMTSMVIREGSEIGARETYNGVTLDWRDKSALTALLQVLQYVQTRP
jgi:hypothetical protein